MTRLLLLPALFLSLFCASQGQDGTATSALAQPPPAATDNDIARWLAGLPPSGDALRAFVLVPAWKEHAEELAKAWDESERDRMTKVRQWAPTALGGVCTGNSPVFYFFSGADFLYPHALFPNAKSYVMCAREPVGSQPDPTRIESGELPFALATFRKSLSTLLDFSYFITTDLRRDVDQRHIPGILPVLELILAREGNQVIETMPVRCDGKGTLTMGSKGRGGSPGVRIRFRKGEQPEQALYYFYGDISNEGLKTHGGVLRFCESLGRGRSMLKAASFLPHEGGFSRINEWILGNSNAVLQDTSGIPFGAFPKDRWRLRFWGRNAEPIEIFKKYAEPDLQAAVDAGSPLRIPFGFGYQYDAAKSLLILAEREDAR
ncbi:MAG: hypothetical protein ABIP20_03620 [Chthoniobacteraceae bacterium]